MRINTNVASMNAQQINSNTQKEIGNSLEKLASGHSINKASDDAAGLAISDKLRTQADSLNQGIKNSNSGVAMIQMADKAMEEQSNILNTVKTKLIQAGTATTTDDGVKNISDDIKKLLTQLDNIASQTDYNGTTVLQQSSSVASSGENFVFQVGEKGAETITATRSRAANTVSLGGTGNVGALSSLKAGALSTSAQAGSLANVKSFTSTAMAIVDAALTQLNDIRSEFGSTQNQLESSVRNQQVTVVNLKAAESTIRDTDYAAESANFNKLNIVSQAGMYAISQANSSQQNVMKLLQ